MLIIEKDIFGLRGKWESGKGNGGEDPGAIEKLGSKGKTRIQILEILRMPIESREFIPIDITFHNGRKVLATSVTIGLRETITTRLFAKIGLSGKGKNPHSHNETV